MASTAPHNPPFRADHVGSFLRPPELLKARADHQAGKLPAAGLRRVEDDAIRQLVAFQERVGLQSITDGEYRRGFFYSDFYSRGLGGVTIDVEGPKGDFTFGNPQGAAVGAPMPRVSGRMRWREPIHVGDFRFLQSLTSRMIKITLPSPTIIHARARARISKEAYPGLDLFWEDIVDAFRKEFRALAEAGCRYVQIDETTLIAAADPRNHESIRKHGDDPDKLLYELYPAIISRTLEGRPPALHVALHICRGNNRSLWHSEGGYDSIADVIFNQLGFDSYFLEYDSPRAGSFAPLRFVPNNKAVVLGLVTTKFPELESRDDLRRRIDEAARYCDRDQLAISPQCGFASIALGNKITPEVQEAKLRLVIDVAREVWGS